MNEIVIMGCGFLGKELAKLLYESKSPFRAVVSTNASKLPLLKMGYEVEAFQLDDQEHHQGLCSYVAGRSAIYTIPPPKEGVADSRLQTLLKNWQKGEVPSKVVYISTTGVYGDSQGEWIDEEWPTEPTTERGKRRLDAEQLWQAWCEKNDVPLVILRVVGIYSQERLPKQSIESGRPLLKESQAGYSNRIHVHDLARVAMQMLQGDYQGIFNVSDGHPTSMTDYFNRVADYLGMPRPPQVDLHEAPKVLSPEMLSYLNESRRIRIDKLTQCLDYSFVYPTLEQSLPAKPQQ